MVQPVPLYCSASAAQLNPPLPAARAGHTHTRHPAPRAPDHCLPPPPPPPTHIHATPRTHTCPPPRPLHTCHTFNRFAVPEGDFEVSMKAYEWPRKMVEVMRDANAKVRHCCHTAGPLCPFGQRTKLCVGGRLVVMVHCGGGAHHVRGLGACPGTPLPHGWGGGAGSQRGGGRGKARQPSANPSSPARSTPGAVASHTSFKPCVRPIPPLPLLASALNGCCVCACPHHRCRQHPLAGQR